MDKRFEPLATGEVLSVDETFQVLIGHRTFRVSELAEAIKAQLEYGIQGWTQEKDGWFSEEGIPCEVLRFTALGWQKGKVRINLEFCPLDSDQEPQAAASHLENKSYVAQPPATVSDELSLYDSPIDMVDEFELQASASNAVEMDLEESLIITQDEFYLETPVVSNEELQQEEPNAIYGEMEQEAYTSVSQDEFVIGDEISTSLDNEFGMDEPMPTSLDNEFGMDEPMPTSLDDEFGMDEPMQTSLDDEFDQISESIEQELELVESPEASSDELLDLSEMSVDSDDDLDFGEMSLDSDENIDFGEISASGEGEFQFEEISFNSDLEDESTDSLLDDVWQDINQPSWQNHQ